MFVKHTQTYTDAHTNGQEHTHTHTHTHTSSIFSHISPTHPLTHTLLSICKMKVITHPSSFTYSLTHSHISLTHSHSPLNMQNAGDFGRASHQREEARGSLCPWPEARHSPVGYRRSQQVGESVRVCVCVCVCVCVRLFGYVSVSVCLSVSVPMSLAYSLTCSLSPLLSPGHSTATLWPWPSPIAGTGWSLRETLLGQVGEALFRLNKKIAFIICSFCWYLFTLICCIFIFILFIRFSLASLVCLSVYF